MGRISLLDGLRGYFLTFMLLNHLTFAGGLWLAKVNHAELGYVQDAQGFVFLSGMLIGLVYARKFARGGGQEASRRMLHRAFQLYLYALGVLLVILALAQFLPFSWAYWEEWLGHLYADDQVHTAAAAALLYQPSYMDILPQYICYLLVAPPLLALVARGRWHWVVAGSGLLWLAVQTGMTAPLTAALEAQIQVLAPAFTLRAAFNPLAWQVLFMGGMVLGGVTALGAVDWRRVLDPKRTELLVIGFWILGFFMIWRLGFTFGLVPDNLMQAFARFDNRTELGLVYLVNFVAACYVVTWLFVAGQDAEQPLLRRIAGVMHKIASLPFLTFIGKHSLQVYAYHVVVVYLLLAFDWWYGPFGAATKTLLALLAIASLWLPAWLHENGPRLLHAASAMLFGTMDGDAGQGGQKSRR